MRREINYQPKVTNVYARNWNSTARIVINRGGTRSSKTYSICQLAVKWLLTGMIRKDQSIPKGVFSIVRKTFPSLKASALRDVQEIIDDNDLNHILSHNKTDHIITLPGSGRYLEFFSVDQAQKVRSRGRKILYCVEGNELDYMSSFYQMLMRTQDLVFIDLNPDDPYNWINEQLEQKRKTERGDVEVIQSTYKDNPTLSKEHVSEIEYMESVDQELWKVYGLGEYGKVTGLVFPDVKVVKEFPEHAALPGYGLDFGFVNHPSALVRAGVLNKTDLYFDEYLYQTGLTNQELARSFTSLNVSRSDNIFADKAEQKSIQELRIAGFNVVGADKGPGSVIYGINTMKKYKIHITERSYNFLREQKKYKWILDKDGNPTNQPIKLFDDAWDAARYYSVMTLATPFQQPTMHGIKY